MVDAESRRWPRWWALDDWILLLILTPAWALLVRIGRLRNRPLRLTLTISVVVAVAVISALVIWPA